MANEVSRSKTAKQAQLPNGRRVSRVRGSKATRFGKQPLTRLARRTLSSSLGTLSRNGERAKTRPTPQLQLIGKPLASVLIQYGALKGRQNALVLRELLRFLVYHSNTSLAAAPDRLVKLSAA